MSVTDSITITQAINEVTVTAQGSVGLNAGGQIDGNLEVTGTLAVGGNQLGKDVRFWGETANKYFLWDASQNKLIITGDLTVDGVTTTIDSEHLVVHDPIITLGGSSVPTSADSKDRGVEHFYYDTSAGAGKRGFFGWSNADNAYKFLTDCPDPSGAEIFTGTAAKLLGQDFLAGSNGKFGWSGDTNTYIYNLGDRILFSVGGLGFADFSEGAQDIVHFNYNENQDIDFKVGYNGGTSIFSEGSSGNVGIGTTAPTAPLHIGGGVSDTYAKIGYYWTFASNTLSSSGALKLNAGSGESIHLQENGTDRLVVKHTTGNVGIGVAAPSAKLEVSSAPLSNQLYLRDSSDNEITHNFWVDGAGNGQFWMYGEGQGTAKNVFSTNGASYFNGGNVGIGTTTPSQKLTVEGNIELGTGGYIYGDTTTPYLRLSNAAGAVLGYLNAYISLGETFVYNSGGTERFRIVSSSGNVGIANNNPAQKLSVTGSAAISSTLYLGSESSTGTRIQADANLIRGYYTSGSDPRFYLGRDAFAGGYAGLIMGGSGGYSGIGCTTNGNDLLFSTNMASLAGGIATERMRIDSAGTVSIGTSAPSDFASIAADDLVIKGSGDTGITIATSNTAKECNLYFSDGSGASSYRGAIQYKHVDDSMRLYAAAVERLRLESGGLVRVFGDLQVDGTTTTVNSTVVTIDDPVLTLGGDTAPSSDDNKDRGIEFRYYDGSAKIGFMGWDDSAGGFTLLKDATNSSEVFSGTAASLATGAISTSGHLSITGDKSILNQGDAAKGSIRFYDQSGGIIMLNGGTTNALRFDSHVKFLADMAIKDGSGNSIFQFYTSSFDGVSAPITRFGATMVLEGANAPSFLSRDNIVLRIDSNNDSTSNYFSVEADAGTELFRIKETGNVGIGTTSPSSRLEIKASSYDGTIRFAVPNNSAPFVGATAGTAIIFQTYTGTDHAAIYVDNNNNFTIGGADIHLDGAVSGDRFKALTAGTLAFPSIQLDDTSGDESGFYLPATNQIGIITDRLERVRIDGSGNVAIGQTVAGYKLDVDGDIRIKDAHNLLLGDGADFQINHNGSDTFITNLTGNVIFGQAADAKDIIFQSDDGSGSVATYLTIDGSAGETTLSKNLTAADNVMFKAGTDGDLRIYFNGNGNINNVTGDLVISNSVADREIFMRGPDGSGGVTNYLTLDGAGLVTLQKKLRADDDVKIEAGSSGDLQILHTSDNSYVQNTKGHLFINNQEASTNLYLKNHDGSSITQYLTLSASQGYTLADKDIRFGDAVRARFGNSSDLTIQHTGSVTRMVNNTGQWSLEQQAAGQSLVMEADNGSGGVTSYLTIDGGREEVVANKPLVQTPGTVDPANNGELAFTVVSNTSIKIKYKGTDGTVRSTSLTLS